MTRRVGMAVLPDVVAIAVVRRGRVVWRGERTVRGDHGDAARALLAQVPRTRFAHRRIIITLFTPWARRRRAEGLASALDARTATRAIRANAEAFFVSEVPLTLTDAVRDADDVWSCGVCEQRPLDLVVDVVRAIGWSVTRIVVADECGDTSAADLALRAATLGRKAPFSWRPALPVRRRQRWAALRIAGAAAFCLVSAGFAATARELREMRLIAVSRAALGRRRTDALEAARLRAEIARTSARVARVQRYEAARGESTMLLSELAATLPESCAVVTMRVDTLGGTFTLVSPHATDALSELAGLTRLTDARLVGAVARDQHGALGLERASFRFRRRAAIALEPTRRAR